MSLSYIFYKIFALATTNMYEIDKNGIIQGELKR